VSETSTDTEAPEATPDAPEAPAAVATEEPVADVADEAVEEGTPAEEYEPEGPAGPRARDGLATLYLCERGHRTLAIWSDAPSSCHARPTRSGPECGRPVYHSTELPEQVQKALNPLKASKKSSKG
jgi:hypothetical protein